MIDKILFKNKPFAFVMAGMLFFISTSYGATKSLQIKHRQDEELTIVGSFGGTATIPVSFDIRVNIPTGFKINTLGPSEMRLNAVGSASTANVKINAAETNATVQIPPKGSYTLEGNAQLFYCEDKQHGRCFLSKTTIKKTFTESDPHTLAVTIIPEK
jgi:hypothetical protein